MSDAKSGTARQPGAGDRRDRSAGLVSPRMNLSIPLMKEEKVRKELSRGAAGPGHMCRLVMVPVSAMALTTLVALLFLLSGCRAAASPDSGEILVDDYSSIAEALADFIGTEMEGKDIRAISIALVRDQETVWARGFGKSDPEAAIPATAETVYRVGSVSKLFTDIAIMQAVARGDIDLDAPVTRYLPDFRPINPFGGEITLRQLMSHRSGLVREPPVGNYFDPVESTLAETVESLNRTSLIYPPETRAKYSNAAIATVGYVLEEMYGRPFPEYVREAVLEPLGMGKSAFAPTAELEKALARAEMWTVDGRSWEAPTFQLGMSPAGSMYSTVTELAEFLSRLFAAYHGDSEGVLTRDMLQEMWTPQFAGAETDEGFGIGFAVDRLDGHRRVGHGGAIYGFSTQLSALPDDALGVVVVASKDMAGAVVERIAEAALQLMLTHADGRTLPLPTSSHPLPEGLAIRLAGHYEGAGGQLDLAERQGRLLLVREGIPAEVRATDTPDSLVVDGLLRQGTVLHPGEGLLVLAGETYRRVPKPRPAEVPSRWTGLIGEYGWDHNTLYILERDAQLYALIEWFFPYPLEEVSDSVFRFPARGLYDGEELIFTRDGSGRATSVEAASVHFRRRDVGTPEGETFRITPLRPVEQLRADALASTPPQERGEFKSPDLVEPSSLDPLIRLDVRYASTNNFMSAVFYDEARVFLQRGAAEGVVRAHRRLSEHGFGLILHDGYRPWYVTKMFWDATPETMKIFVANPDNGSRHNRGAAIDLNMFDLATGEPVEMVGGYDEFSPRSYPDYPGGTSLQRWRRDLLREAMDREGFDVYEAEWWHFDYREWRDFPILNVRFSEIER